MPPSSKSPNKHFAVGSSAAETALNRATVSRLKQAETLFAMIVPNAYPASKFQEAWRQVLHWDEHTWGAHCSISKPEFQMTKDQWAYKRAYALDAAKSTDALIEEVGALREGMEIPNAVDIYNTSSLKRSELVYLSPELSKGGDLAEDKNGHLLPSQRMASGELAVLVKDLPGFSVARVILKPGTPPNADELKVEGATLANNRIKLRVDEKTGAISEFYFDGVASNLADTSRGALNSYLYFTGSDNTKVEPVSNVRVGVKEKGPLLASLLVERDAPGCKKLVTEIRLTAGGDTVEIFNLTDKARLEAKSYWDTKESLNFGFPFNIPEGQVRLEVPFGVFRPDLDQLPGSNKNWFSVGSWADISNKEFGVTWHTLDAPLVQVGELSANLLNSQTKPEVWRKNVGQTQVLYSWAMNNHWGTNARAYQEGPVMFRFLLQPHKGGCNEAEASRRAQASMELLLVLPATGQAPSSQPLVRVDSQTVIASAFKPSDDGKALILRLFNTSAQPATAKLLLREKPRSVRLSGTDEKGKKETISPLSFNGFELKCLRIEK